MKERPIIFNGDMVRAILDGRKTQTRRPVKPQPNYVNRLGIPFCQDGPVDYRLCPNGAPGDRLWVRETWACPQSVTFYRANEGNLLPPGAGWTPSIHMPRWASRITLEVTAVRVEQVQDITEEDAKREGVDSGIWERDAQLLAGVSDADDAQLVSFRDGFGFLWQSIYGTWDANPWVWVIEFRRIQP